MIRCVYKISKSDSKLHHFLPSVRPHEITRFPLGGSSSNLMSEYFSKICRVSSSLIKMSIIVQQDATTYSLLYICKLPYMFRDGNSTHHQEHMQLQLQHLALVKLRKIQCVKSAKDERYVPVSVTFTHCIFRSLTSSRCCNYSYMCS